MARGKPMQQVAKRRSIIRLPLGEYKSSGRFLVIAANKTPGIEPPCPQGSRYV